MKFDVIVVGAGCAGLKAAETLHTNGVTNILLLEALERTGGRLDTIWLNDDSKVPIELGANWIHGLKGNPLFELTERNKDVFFHEKEKLFEQLRVSCVDQNGCVYEESLAQEMVRFFDDLVEESRRFWLLNAECEFSSFDQFIQSRLEDSIRNDSAEMKSLKRALIQQQAKVLCFEIGCARLSESSVREYGSYVRFDETNYEFPGGYKKLVKFLEGKIPKERVKVSHPVAEISLNDDNSLTVKCESGVEFTAEHVIVTCSLNYLKKHSKSLLPQEIVTQKKLEAIECLQMGYVNKILLVYDDNMPFYPADANTLFVLYPENDFDHENYVLEQEWFKKIGKFDRFFPNVLRTLLTGDEAKHVEKLSEDEIAETLTRLLRKALNNPDIPKPSRVIRTQWCTNPYILGSYTFVSQKTISSKHFTDLAEPLFTNDKVPRILFAGEATHEMYYSTAHAAYLSGQREAERLIKRC